MYELMREENHLLCLKHYCRCFVNLSCIQNKLFVTLRKKLGEIMFIFVIDRIYIQMLEYIKDCLKLWGNIPRKNSIFFRFKNKTFAARMNWRFKPKYFFRVMLLHRLNIATAHISICTEHAVRQSITKMVWRIFPEFKLCLICQFGHAAQLPIIVI